jgi:Right handed beta helix region
MRRPHRYLTGVLVIVLFGYSLASSRIVRAGGSVTDCSTYGPGPGTLQDALAGGGTVTFGCSGTIIVPLITVEANTSLDATGQTVTLSGNDLNGVLQVNGGVTLHITQLTIANGGSFIGAISNSGMVTITTSTVSDNDVGIDNTSSGTATIINSTISGNWSVGIRNSGTVTISNSTISGNYSGGIYNDGGMVTITTSTVSGNWARAFGGGIDNRGGTMTVTNSTFSGNRVSPFCSSTQCSDSHGGGIYNSGTMTVTTSTVSGNWAEESCYLSCVKVFGGGIYNVGTLNLGNTIVAGNTAILGPDISGGVSSGGYNLIGNTSGASGFIGSDLLNVNPKLGGLTNNGGPTPTMALLEGSPAINAIPGCNGGPATDQRGVSRPQGIACDIGAFELESAVVKETVGIFRQSLNTYFLKNSNTTGTADITHVFGMAPTTDLPVVGDWDGDGVDTVGVYNPSAGQYRLKNSNAPGSPIVFTPVLGIPGDRPMAGDWNSDGVDGIGVYRPSSGLIYLKNDPTTSGIADFTMVLGIPGDVAVAGDWNGDGKDSPGVYRPSWQRFFLTNQVCNCGVFADYSPILGVPGDVALAGDWTGSGRTGIGVFRPSNGLIYLKNDPTVSGIPDIKIVFGIPNDLPVAGHWIAGPLSIAQPKLIVPEPPSTPPLAPTFVPRAPGRR